VNSGRPEWLTVQIRGKLPMVELGGLGYLTPASSASAD